MANEARENVVVDVEAHRTFAYIAERQAKERSDFAMAVSLCDSDVPDDRNTGRDLLEQIQVRLANQRINSQRQIQPEYNSQW